jgi:hypothetical protein
LVAALGRASGDFIIEWQGEFESLSEEVISSLLEPSNSGYELVEFETGSQKFTSRIFYKLVNLLRPSNIPVRKCVGRAFSRRALGLLLQKASFEPQINILFSELPVRRIIKKVEANFAAKQNLRERFIEGMNLLSKGTRFGTVIPLALAIISATFGFLAAFYALALYLLIGKSPEGWTTLMIATGLGQASILALIGMTWSRVDALSKGLSRHHDSTTDVQVFPSTR